MDRPNEQTTREWNESCKYEDHFVAILDILGFSKLVENEQLNYAIAGCLDLVERLSKEQRLIEATKFTGLKTAVISDSIVFSINCSCEKAFSILCAAISATWFTYISSGMVLRGGISKGKLLHLENNVVFGPALVAAHQLEQHVAIYPRVVIDNTIENFLIDNPEYAGVFTECNDGVLFLDMLRTIILKKEKAREDERSLSDLVEVISKGIEENKDNLHIKQKYSWLKNLYENWLNEAYNNNLIDLDFKNKYWI